MALELGLALLAFSLVGLLDAAYFTLVSYGLLRPDARWVPPLCRMDRRSCARLLDTRYARVAGFPNSVFGILWYGATTGAAGVTLKGEALPNCATWIVAAFGTVLVSAYLAWALIARLRVACALCFTAHAINLGLFGLLLVACTIH